MEQLIGSDTLIEGHLEYSEQYEPEQYKYTRNHYQQQDEPASPKFYKETSKKNPGKSQHYNDRLVDEIKPYVDDILADQNINSVQVQRGLQQLRIIQDKMMDLIDDNQEQSSHRQRNPTESNYLLQIQRTVDQLIENAAQQSNEFKASLHHLKNVNNTIFNDQQQQPQQYDDEEQEEDSRIKRIDTKTQKISKESNLNQVFQGISNLQQRLFNEIMILRQQKEEAINELHHQRERYNELQRKYRMLQNEYNKVLNNKHDPFESRIQFDDIPQRHYYQQSRQPKSNYRPQRPQRPQRQRTINREKSNLKNQMVEVEHRLRAADQQRSMLQQEIHKIRQQPQQNNRYYEKIQSLNANLAASERKAAALFPYKVTHDRLVQQLQVLRSENQHLNHGSRYIQNTHNNNYRHYDDDSYQANNRKKSRFSRQQSRVNDYRNVISSHRQQR